MTSLKHRAVSGVQWSALSQGGRQGIQLLTTLILARLLSPADFGLMSMAVVITGFVAIFRDLGTSASVIQRRELTDGLLSSIFWVNMGFGTLISLLILILAPVIVSLYQEPRLLNVIRLLSAGFVVAGVGILHQTLLERSMSFDVLAKIELLSIFTGALVALFSAITGAGVWSLVYQSLVTAFVSSILLWVYSHWRPRWIFSLHEIKSVSGFSLNLTGFNIVNYFARNADYVLIGRFLGAQDLGYYTLAYRILLFPLQNISDVVGRVMFPLLSGVQDDNRRFALIYLKVIKAVALIAFPLMVAAFVLAEPLVITFLGSGWQRAIPLVMILAPVGLIQSVGATVGMIYQAKGRTDVMLRWGVAAGLAYISAFVVGLRSGITGVASVYAITAFLLMYPGFRIPFGLIDLRFMEFVRSLTSPILNSLVLFFVLILVKFTAMPSWSNELILAISILAGVSVYFYTTWRTDRGQIVELWGMVRDRNSPG